MEKLGSVHSGSKTNLRWGPAEGAHTTLAGRNGLGSRLMSLLHQHGKPGSKSSVKAEVARWQCEGCGASVPLSGKPGATRRIMILCPTCRKQVLVYDQRQGLSQFPAKEWAKTT